MIVASVPKIGAPAIENLDPPARSLILAMECKVSNDATNSVKRIHDVTDKTKSWNDKWGDFIQTAALLQGVVAYKEVAALLDHNVLVFWSHDLQPLADWLDEKSSSR